MPNMTAQPWRKTKDTNRIEMVAARHLSWMVPLSQKLEIRLVPRGVDDPVMSVEMKATD